MRRSFGTAFAVASLVTLLSACGGISDPSQNTVVDFTQTIAPGEGKVHEFDVSRRNGEYTATIVAMAPTQSTILQIFLGNVVGGVCAPLMSPVVARLSNQPSLSGTISKGHYCIQVFDQFIISTPQTYTLRVSHP